MRLFDDGPLLRAARRLPWARRLVRTPLPRMLLVAAAAWLPLLLLSARAGSLFGGPARGFFQDIQTHARLLVRLPLYVFAAYYADAVGVPGLSAFVKRGLVRAADRRRFRRIVSTTAVRLRSPALRAGLFAAAVIVGHLAWAGRLAIREPSWHGEAGRWGSQLTPAGWWLVVVSNPLVAYLHVLWLARLAALAIMLARVAALDLNLVPTHPDHAGGLGFLGSKTYGLAPLALAEGAGAAGLLANRIMLEGRPPAEFAFELVACALVVVGFILAPLLVFAPRLFRTRRAGLMAYGALSNRYMREFDDAWIEGRAYAQGRELLGAADIQSLADMANGYWLVRSMRLVPIGRIDALTQVFAFLLPFAPLLLSVYTADALSSKLLMSFLF